MILNKIFIYFNIYNRRMSKKKLFHNLIKYINIININLELVSVSKSKYIKKKI